MDAMQKLLVVALAAPFIFASALADAESTRRVVVTKFGGPAAPTTAVRTAVLEVLEDFYDVVPYRKYRIERRRIGLSDRSKKKAIATVARRLRCDAVVFGKIEENRLTVKVREGGSGVLVGKFRVDVKRGVNEGLLERLEDELTDLIDSTERVDDGKDSLERSIRPADAGHEKAQARLAAFDRAAPPSVRAAWDVESALDDEEKPSKPSPIALHALVGVGGTSRSLAFAQQGNLEPEERPQSMTGAPALGVAFTGVAELKALGISAELNYERSVGASISIRDGAGAKRVGSSQKFIGLRVFAARKMSRRLTLRGGAGYGQRAFTLSNKPNGLRLHDTRYSYVDVGGGARLSVRDDRVTLTADASYLYVLAIGGITDPKAYGTGRAQGLASEAGVELVSSQSTFIRVALRYSRIVTYFDGNGDLATKLDGNDDIDVSGAADTSVGGLALMGFHF